MDLSVSMCIELTRERRVERELHLGQPVTLGRRLTGSAPDRVDVPGRWLGVAQDGMVSAELLRVVYQDVDAGRAVVGWRTGAQHHPAAIRFGTAPPGAEPDLAGEGRLLVGPGQVGRLFVSRLSARNHRFEPRFVVALSCARSQRPAVPVMVPPPTQGPDENHWLPLVEDWWRPRRREPDAASVVSWQRCLQVTARLVVEGTPEGALAAAVAQALRHRGHADADADVVRKAWTRAMARLADELAEPARAWMVTALAVPGLAEYLAAAAAGGARPRLPAGEAQIRHLAIGLRATGRAEWQ